MIWIKKIKLQSSDTRALILSTEMMKKFSIKRNKPKPSLSVISRLLFHQQQTLRTPPPLSSSFLAPDSSSSFFHHPPLLTFFFISSTLIFLVKFTHPSFYIPSFSLYFNFVIPGLPSFPLPLLRSEAFCRFCMFMNVFIYNLWWLLNHPGVFLAQVRPWKVSCGPCSSWLFLSERE